MPEERLLGTVTGHRKGRGRRLCRISICLDDLGPEIVLRTEDVSGVSPLVATLALAEASSLADLITRALASKGWRGGGNRT